MKIYFSQSFNWLHLLSNNMLIYLIRIQEYYNKLYMLTEINKLEKINEYERLLVPLGYHKADSIEWYFKIIYLQYTSDQLFQKLLLNYLCNLDLICRLCPLSNPFMYHYTSKEPWVMFRLSEQTSIGILDVYKK